MKRYLAIGGILLAIAFLAVQTQAGPPITQGINTGALGAISASSITDTGLTASKPVFTDASKVLTSTGTLAVDQGGTGRATGDSGYGLITTGTTATGAQQTVTAGASTAILVGGGASALPVWTTATGSDAPVRATQPTITSPTLTSPIATAAYVSAGSEKMTGGTTWTGATGATPPIGWAVVNAGLFDIVDSGDGVPYDIALRISVDATPTASPAITIPITTILGHGYSLSYAFKKGTAVSGYVKVGSTSGGSEYYLSGALTDATWTTRYVNFIAAGTTVYVTLMNNSAVAGETALFDTVQFTENPLTVDGPLNLGGILQHGNAQYLTDEGTITLPKVSENWSGHGWVRVTGGGAAINDSAEFEVGHDGNVNLIRGTANVVVGAACADTKICISTAASQNPVIIKARNGNAYVAVEFWYK